MVTGRGKKQAFFFLLEALLSAVPDVILHAQTLILIAINY